MAFDLNAALASAEPSRLALGLGMMDFDGSEEFDGHEPDWDNEDELASDLEVIDGAVFEGEVREEDDGGEIDELGNVEMDEGDHTEAKAVEEREEEDEEDDESGDCDDEGSEGDEGVETSGEEPWVQSHLTDTSDLSRDPRSVAEEEWSSNEGSIRDHAVRSRKSLEDVTNVQERQRSLRPRPKPFFDKDAAIVQASSSHFPRIPNTKRRLRDSDDEWYEDVKPRNYAQVPKKLKGPQARPVPVPIVKGKRQPKVPQEFLNRLTFRVGEASEVQGTTTKATRPTKKGAKAQKGPTAVTGTLLRCPFHITSPEYYPFDKPCDWTTDASHRDDVAQHMEKRHSEDPRRGFVGGAEIVRQIRFLKLEYVVGTGLQRKSPTST